jgi:hypothetical protein
MRKLSGFCSMLSTLSWKLHTTFHDGRGENAGIPECWRNCQSDIVSFTVSPPRHSGIGSPASTLVRYRWSRISPVVPSYAGKLLCWQNVMIARIGMLAKCYFGAFAVEVCKLTNWQYVMLENCQLANCKLANCHGFCYAAYNSPTVSSTDLSIVLCNPFLLWQH